MRHWQVFNGGVTQRKMNVSSLQKTGKQTKIITKFTKRPLLLFRPGW